MLNPQLLTFKKVAETKSFTKASQQLYISHTAIIKQINQLENHLGVKLFKRSNQGVTITSAGVCLLDKVDELIKLSDETIAKVQQAFYASPTPIRVGTSQFYPCNVFMDLWDEISQDCPQYQLDIVPIDDANRFSGLAKDYDFLVGPYNSTEKGFDYPFYQLGSYQFTMALPKKHPLASKKKIKLNQLNDETIMIMKQGHSEINDQLRQLIQQESPKVYIVDINPNYNYETFNQCVKKNCLLVSLQCWQRIHPSLISVPIDTSLQLPYGILASNQSKQQLDQFISVIYKHINIKKVT